MRLINFIKNEDIVKKILKHLGLWKMNRKPSPRPNTPSLIPDLYPTLFVNDYVTDHDYPVEAYL